MVTSELSGGLGNQMFQIAAALSLAKDNNDEAVFDFEKHISLLQGKKATEYMGNIYKRLINNSFKPSIVYAEKTFTYDKIPYTKDIKLVGYFQSEKYFETNSEYIVNIFSPTEYETNQLKKKYEIFNDNTCELVSLHVRRGDYLKFSNIHPPIDIHYINKSLENFKDAKIFVFSDDMRWCANNIKSVNGNKIYFANTIDYESLYLMSMCHHNIMSNSSFSWWGAYLNRNSNKKIIAPKRWFGENSGLTPIDLYIKNSIII